ncbi:hypothetical protein RRG08_033019 [Elysia crispata]|uniref:Uncharacterized protein n=1 Tax=Elysia crispata TaxID=231223 RepID=A0AAE1DWS1_9GAST|nr:hypothetical protein RRG08_033019 [Elysia crispata]
MSVVCSGNPLSLNYLLTHCKPAVSVFWVKDESDHHLLVKRLDCKYSTEILLKELIDYKSSYLRRCFGF